jgi:hypothetical protein
MVHLYTTEEPDQSWSNLFNEGMAVYLGDEYAALRDDIPDSDLSPYMPAERYLQALPDEQQISVRDVHAWPPNATIPNDKRIIRYLTAGSFVHYLAEERDFAVLTSYLKDNRVEPRAARDLGLLDRLEEAFGSSIEQLELDWRAWMATLS